MAQLPVGRGSPQQTPAALRDPWVVPIPGCVGCRTGAPVGAMGPGSSCSPAGMINGLTPSLPLLPSLPLGQWGDCRGKAG